MKYPPVVNNELRTKLFCSSVCENGQKSLFGSQNIEILIKYVSVYVFSEVVLECTV